jgi:hypothetical protein
MYTRDTIMKRQPTVELIKIKRQKNIYLRVIQIVVIISRAGIVIGSLRIQIIP